LCYPIYAVARAGYEIDERKKFLELGKSRKDQICDDFPHQGLSEARRGRKFSSILYPFLIRRGGAPPGAAGFIVIENA